MGRALILLYGVASYLLFLAVFLCAIWFVMTMDRQQQQGPLLTAFLVNTGLLGLFAVQHSIMARQWFKRAWTRIIPQPAERSTFVLFTNLILLALFYFWQPMTMQIWKVESTVGSAVLNGLFWFGWLVVLVSTFLIDHFDLFGLKQVWYHWRNQPFGGPAFRIPGPYKFVRHPLYVGFIIAFWSTPTMTLGHLYFAFMCTAYMVLAIQFEERDLIRIHGEDYKRYRSGVSMLMPWPGRRESVELE